LFSIVEREEIKELFSTLRKEKTRAVFLVEKFETYNCNYDISNFEEEIKKHCCI
jgi:hypothetical protein